jgi:hypothetical protein
MAQNSSEQLIKIFSQSSNPNAIEYVKSLKKSSKQIDYSPRQSSLEQSYLCLPFDRRGQLFFRRTFFLIF